MERELAEKAVEILQDWSREASFREAYSGRCMYGESTTAAVVCESACDAAVAVGMAFQQLLDAEEGPPEMPMLSQDSMGESAIVY